MLNTIKKVENSKVHLEKRCNICCSTSWIDIVPIDNNLFNEITKVDVCKNCKLKSGIDKLDKQLKN